MKKVIRARPRRIPAFGEWNYYDDGGYGYGDGGGDWPVTQYFDSAMAMQAGLVMALPVSPKPVKKAVKWIDSATLEAEQRAHKVVAGPGEHGAKKQGKQSRVSDSDAGAHLAGRNHKACIRAVKAVDEDLYVIPPDMLCHKPRKGLAKSLWIGCLGLSCIATT
ncbi:uncharacterized protein LOC100828522 isoform X1 [Brachypodium distachyon]|uniref:Uncharacterized protein n=1 Tax=Brachypodium distachyon TaxID=15368 RepID=I1ILV4_BRADI|nr:uncharacterized protein LOC100828522 isoform X1 [Brachypodium distachyon]KQJ88576.1 hypothetical protein BRADI_4g19620v3 [Brachypodium distachyon]|eukprot:XP_003576066.2 uncharacterized protein LOC100828522 isoform X1 [Brachypodium distachyon]